VLPLSFPRWAVVGALVGILPVQGADILRGGAAGGSGASGNSAGASAAGTAGSAAQPKASDSLARTAQAIAAVQAMQAAARSAAQTGANNLGLDPNRAGRTLPNVPDGLTAGGLQRAAGDAAVLWQGADLPTAATAGGQTNVTITQRSQQALLNWQTFNVGKNTTLTFDQSAGGDTRGEWIAFNKINDPSGVPSQILGSIKADGQVYLLNQNGIIFGGSSQVNAHALVASTLPINDNLVSRGLLNNPDQQFLFSSLPVAAGANGTPLFTPSAAATPDGKSGDITVQAGAQLSSPTTAEHVGGRIALFGPNVTNAGTLSTPDGQTILAAGQQIGLAAHDSGDPSLRGLDVFVGAGGGTVTQAASALIDAPRAAVSLAGKTINQLGVIASTTSVAFNGRIDLLASHDAISSGGFAGLPPFFPQATGQITLGSNSVTQILPELASTDRVVGSQLALRSVLNLQGQSIYLGSKSTVLAPNGQVSVDAGTWFLTGAGATARDQFVYTRGQIYLDTGATIDVSGSTGVTAPVSENIVAVELRGAELANVPLQRDGALRGETILVDVRQTGTYNGQPWVGTPLADASGYIALADHTVGELTTAGGSVKLRAGESVVMQAGASVDVSGGWIDYQGGTVETTKVLSEGRVYDIAQATPDRVYDGIYTGENQTKDPKWGVTSTTSNPQLAANYEPGYRQGGGGGTVAIVAPAMALDGKLTGATYAGPRQRVTGPALSSLSLNFQGQDPALPQFFFPLYSPASPSVAFQTGSNLTPVGGYVPGGTALANERKNTVFLSPNLLGASGFGAMSVDNSDGNIAVPANVSLTAPAGGALTLSAANLDLQGKVAAPGGSLSFTVYDRSPFADRGLAGGEFPANPLPDANRGKFTLGATAELSTAGLFVDDRQGATTAANLPFVLKGGSISIASYSADLVAGSTIDASGGVSISATGRATYGNGGSISVKAGQDPKVGSLLGGRLNLGATLSAYSGAVGGSLSLLAPLVQIGGATTNRDTLLLTPEFFSRGGFNRFAVSGLGAPTARPDEFLPGVLIAPGTTLAPVALSRVVATDMAAGSGPWMTTVLPPGVRSPVSLAFAAPGVRDAFNGSKPIVTRGDLVMGAGATIATGATGSVAFSGDTVFLQGSVSAPGGVISVAGGRDSTILFSDLSRALPTVDLGTSSSLSTAGTTVLTPDARGLRVGSVLPGGTVNISGNIVAEAGAKIDVSGTRGVLDLPATSSATGGPVLGSTAGAVTVPTTVESNGGSIVLAGVQALFSDATLLGARGGASALGGNLTVSSGRFYPVGSTVFPTPMDVTLVVSQSGPTIPTPSRPAGTSAIGQPVLDDKGKPILGAGYFAVSSFNNSGLDSLSLRGTVEFSGPVTIAAQRVLTAATSGVVYANAGVNLSAPYVSLGAPFLPPLQPDQQSSSPFLPAYGSGSITVSAGLIDVGDLSLQGIGKLNLIAANGDVRGDGTLSVAGDISIRAGQIYPPTAVKFTLAAYDYRDKGGVQPGSVTITTAGSRPLPFSAGGSLNIFGSKIDQSGVLRAPNGTINLGLSENAVAPPDATASVVLPATRQLSFGSGSVTSVSAVDPLSGKPLTIPYGINLNGDAWIDPAGVDITTTSSPAKEITTSARDVSILPGATIDLRGGGDLYAYRWVSGAGGTKDILLTSSSFAVVPGYLADYAPFAPNNTSSGATNLRGDPGYAAGGLSVGDKVYLAASAGLPAGNYTLLPARYALLPGAFLVTPKSGVPPAAAVSLPDGASVVAGYRFNDLSATRSGTPPAAAFEVAPVAVTRARAQYDDSFANAFFTQSATARETVVPRLPIDSGQLVLAATNAMSVQGTVSAQAPLAARGGLVDISSPAPIFIGGSGTTAPAGSLLLRASDLNGIGAESLLIGGIRSAASNGTALNVVTDSITVSNTGSPLAGSEIILAANKSLTLAPGAAVEQKGTVAIAADRLLIGDATKPGSGDGVLLRVSSDPTATTSRAGVEGSSAATISVGDNSRVSGAAVTLDSTRITNLSASAALSGRNIALGSGRISLQLSGAGNLPTDAGLVLSGAALQSLQQAQGISLLSYSSIDIYGSGSVGALDAAGQPALASLALHAGELRGFNNGGGSVAFFARDILLDNSQAVASPGAGDTTTGSLTFNGGTVRFGANQFAVDQFARTTITATGGISVQGAGGFTAQGNLTLVTPLLTGATGAQHGIVASGNLTLNAPTGSTAAGVVPGLGASLTLQGAAVSANSPIRLPSGDVTVRATRGDVDIAGLLDVGGVAKSFFDLIKYTDGGQVRLAADVGSVRLASGAVVTVAAPSNGGNSGGVAVSAPAGVLTLAGSLLGGGGVGGQSGSFTLDIGRLTGESTAALDAALNTGGFLQSRSVRVRTGNVTIDGTGTAHSYNMSADQGSITVTSRGLIDASGARGGAIGLEAAGGVTLQSGAKLTVAAKDFDAAGKGGEITLETRGANGGVIDLQTGSTLDLSVASNSTGSAAQGKLAGTLHLRAPQTATGRDLQLAPLNGTVIGASSIVAEGFKIFDLSAAGGATISGAIQAEVMANGVAFADSTAAIATRLLARNGSLASLLHVQPGAEIVNPLGDLTLASAWDMSTFRFGPGNREPGALTLRAAGNLNFDYNFNSSTRTASIGSLNDGFGGESSYGLWDMPLLAAGSQSWSYRLVAGADFGAADFRRVRGLENLGPDVGSVLIGRGAPNLPVATDNAVTRAAIIPDFFQVIRTGTGNIDILAARDVQLLNPLATIYTAGSQVAALANFDPPSLTNQAGSRAFQLPFYGAQYSANGGDVTITAQRDIAHYVLTGSPATLTPDSSRELPTNWLYRRGALDNDGRFATLSATGEVASTSWWIDFSNFFQGVGALGGGNVSLLAGRDVANVDAVVPTNARMSKGTPSAGSLIELGGGDLSVRAGRDIDGGVYYVERGEGALSAGGSIRTNATRAALTQDQLRTLKTAKAVPDSTTWLPTTLFLGKGAFAVEARADLLLGPVANPFLLPQGANNRIYEKSYFLTYSLDSAVEVTSLSGSVTLRNSADLANGFGAGSLASWYANVLAVPVGTSNVPFSASQPWLRPVETDITPFTTVAALLPPRLDAVSFSGDINLVGRLTLSPSPRGSINLTAADSINGLQVKGLYTDVATVYSPVDNPRAWGASVVNLSDADPARLPNVVSPRSTRASATDPALMDTLNTLFAESGSTLGARGVIQAKQALHAAGPLHADDPDPVHVYAATGDISGVTLFSSKAARIVAGNDISDIGFYLQNNRAADVSIVSSGRDLVAFSPNSPARVAAQTPGNTLGVGGAVIYPNSGDIQISGPGTLEVYAGRDLVLGAGRNPPDPRDIDVGITSVGNARNPNLPFQGADVLVAAGIGAAGRFGPSNIDFANFIAKFLNPATSGGAAVRYLPALGALLELPNGTPSQVWDAFNRLAPDRQRGPALEIFYLALRDAGRDHNDPEGPGYKNYDGGFSAISALFKPGASTGNIALSSREIRTKNGGDISILAPGGGLTLGFDVGGSGAPAGILTEHGGNISIFADRSVFVGALRIFTLRGGNEIIWSSKGDIAAGVASKTVQSAPPTRVQVDPQSADIKTDLAGLATGGGIGVLAAVAGVPAGDVDLIAPLGTIDAGDAGIRVSGNLNISALQVVNAANIQSSGTSVGTPTVAAPNFASFATVASSSAASAGGVANEAARQNRGVAPAENHPSLITVEVLGYGGNDVDEALKKSGEER